MLYNQLNKKFDNLINSKIYDYIYGDKDYYKKNIKTSLNYIIKYKEFVDLKCDFCKRIDIYRLPNLTYHGNQIFQLCKNCNKNYFNKHFKLILFLLFFITLFFIIEIFYFKQKIQLQSKLIN